jgi:ABC-type sugar transport system permease subunit
MASHVTSDQLASSAVWVGLGGSAVSLLAALMSPAQTVEVGLIDGAATLEERFNVGLLLAGLGGTLTFVLLLAIAATICRRLDAITAALAQSKA